MSYENALGIFSPDGRLIQVEYAQQASEQGSLVVFVVGEDLIAIAIERKSMNEMLIEQPKLIEVDPVQGIWMSFSGLKPDSYLAISHVRALCRNYKISTGEDMSIDQLASRLGSFKQRYTLDGDCRPLGLRSVLFGFSPEPRVFVVEPDGNFSRYRKGAVGQKSQRVCEYLEGSDERDPVRESVLGLVEVVQSDINKVSSYVLRREGCSRVESERIGSYVK
jgi:20S proteasome subunit alpha 4